MGIALAAVVLAAVSYWLLLVRRSRRDARHSGGEGRRAEHARLAKVAALMLLGLGAGFFLVFALAETAGGDVAGVQHLLPAAGLGALLWLGWRRPRTAGIVLLALAVPVGAAYVAAVVRSAHAGEVLVALWLPLLPVVTGLLLLRAGQGGRGRR